MAKPMKFRTCGGAIVTFTPYRDSLTGVNGQWTCGGCGDSSRNGEFHRYSANEHARGCHAIPD
jgi:hypothetical protein